MALIWAANVKGLKPVAKIVLIQLADFHNKETGQCNPSAQRLADECEMGRATLFRHMTTLEECGLVTRHARGDGDGGRGSNQYELHLDITLGPSSSPRGGGRGSIGVGSQNETWGNVSKKRGKSLKGGTGVVSNRDTNLSNEPVKEPPTHRREAADAEKILAAYPPDRLRAKAACLAQIEEARKEGIVPEDLLRAVQAYASETAGFTRSKVCFSDNWFLSERWRAYLEQVRTAVEAAELCAGTALEGLAVWVREKHPLARTISSQQAAAMVKRGFVTPGQLREVGL